MFSTKTALSKHLELFHLVNHCWLFIVKKNAVKLYNYQAAKLVCGAIIISVIRPDSQPGKLKIFLFFSH